jgi:dienelactone hydrolase
VYDIFGYFPQTLQGADILAYGDKQHPLQVFMPDFFLGDPADISWYPPDNEEKGKKLGAFFQNQAAPPKTLQRIPGIVNAIKKNHGVEAVGVVGYCWGGKIVNLASTQGTQFKVAAACHPAMVDPKDAPNVVIPMAMLPSKDEDKTAVEEYEKRLKVKHVVEWFPDQVHGWMAAR